MKQLAPIIMGSDKDFDFCQKIAASFARFSIPHEYRVASAHKHPSYLLGMLREYDSMPDTSVVYIACAGRQKALAPTIAANTPNPVVSCSPDKESREDIMSSLNMPTGVTFTTVLHPESVGIEVAKLMGQQDAALRAQVEKYLRGLKEEIEAADRRVRRLDSRYYEEAAAHFGDGFHSCIVIRGKYAPAHLEYFMPHTGADFDRYSVPPMERDEVLKKMRERQKKKAVVLDAKGEGWPEEFYILDTDALVELKTAGSGSSI